jgi:uncharacterized protein
MSPEERQLLQGVFDRMRNNASAPRDSEADQLIADNVRQQPYSPYFLTQAVIVQEQALQAANQRIKQLEQQAQGQPGQSSGGGFLSSIFGGGASRPTPPAPQPAPVWNQGNTGFGQQPGYGQGGPGFGPGGYPPQQGGPWGGAPAAGGGGFLHGALQTAAGVAGGALLFDGIRDLMGGHGSPFGIGAGMPVGGETVVNNYYGDSSGGSDWSQDANQDQDTAQDMSDYGVDDNSSDY